MVSVTTLASKRLARTELFLMVSINELDDPPSRALFPVQRIKNRSIIINAAIGMIKFERDPAFFESGSIFWVFSLPPKRLPVLRAISSCCFMVPNESWKSTIIAAEMMIKSV